MLKFHDYIQAELNQKWKQIVGEEFADIIKVDYIDQNDVMHVLVDNVPCATAVMALKHKIIDKWNKNVFYISDVSCALRQGKKVGFKK